MNRTIRDIYEEYRYELFKVSAALSEIPMSDTDEHREEIVDLFDRGERLEALIDLYAYLLASGLDSRPSK
ncbi:MAG: hypothetical protein JO102_02325 [Elusimicrobia bacterium]|nr:hypothetical protein [Elusimicrobiota bacterium]